MVKGQTNFRDVSTNNLQHFPTVIRDPKVFEKVKFFKSVLLSDMQENPMKHLLLNIWPVNLNKNTILSNKQISLQHA